MQNDLAIKVLEHCLGHPPQNVRALEGGKSNFVFEADAGGEKYVVRLSDEPARLEDFLKEQWAVSKAREKGVPAPDILEVGTQPVGVPYMILRHVAGRPATLDPAPTEIFRELGGYASRINSIPTSSFGHVFEWSRNALSRRTSWNEYLEKEYKALDRLRLLEENNLISSDLRARLRDGLARLETWTRPPSLNHADLRLKNVLLNPQGRIAAILDWEKCVSHVAPCWELSIALHDLSIKHKEAFLDGYGLTASDYLPLAPAIKLFNILNYSSEASGAAEKRDQHTLERLRLRLSGALDLFSL